MADSSSSSSRDCLILPFCSLRIYDLMPLSSSWIWKKLGCFQMSVCWVSAFNTKCLPSLQPFIPLDKTRVIFTLNQNAKPSFHVLSWFSHSHAQRVMGKFSLCYSGCKKIHKISYRITTPDESLYWIQSLWGLVYLCLKIN